MTTSEVTSRGVYEHLRRATEDGTLMRIRQGVYVETSALANNMIDVQRIVPGGVLCLYSAFAHYGLSTQVPAATCVAIDAKITDLERTICDAVKYRNKIGLDVCGEVIDNYLKTDNRNISLLHEYAAKLRVKNTLIKYLETRL